MNPPRNPTVSPWIKAFVAFHILAITIWALPKPKQDVIEGRVPAVGSDRLLVFNEKELRTFPPVQAYLFATGTWQYWDMFAPDPAQTDIWSDADVEMQDGSHLIVGYPRMYSLSLPQKYISERYRKFYERAGADTGAYLWPMFARMLAKKAVRLSGKAPRIITLRRHYIQIMPPGDKQAQTYTDYAYFRYVVLPGDLD